MKKSKAIEILMQLKAEYFYAYKDLSDELFNKKVDNLMTAMQDYNDQEIDIALEIVIKENKNVPTTAHFIEVLERNREMILPSAEEEWVAISNAIMKIKRNRDIYDVNERCSENDKEYNTLSQDVKDFYVSYSGFCDLLESKNIDIEKTRFLKCFAEFRRWKQAKAKLLKVLKQ